MYGGDESGGHYTNRLPKHPRLSRYIFTLHPSPFFFLKKFYLFIYFLQLHQNKMVLCFSITNSNNQATIQWWFVDLASSLLLLLLSRSPIATTQQPSPIILKLVERERAMAIRIRTHFWSEIGDGFMYFLITFVFLHIIAWNMLIKEEEEWVATSLSDLHSHKTCSECVNWRRKNGLRLSCQIIASSQNHVFFLVSIGGGGG